MYFISLGEQNLPTARPILNASSGEGLDFHDPLPTGVTFTGGGAALRGDFGDITFTDFYFVKHFEHRGWEGEAGPNFVNATFDSINFYDGGQSLANTSFTGTCTLLNNAFTSMTYTNFTGTNFGNCDLTSASIDWTYATCPDGTLVYSGGSSESCQDDGMGGDHMTPQ